MTDLLTTADGVFDPATATREDWEQALVAFLGRDDDMPEPPVDSESVVRRLQPKRHAQ